jgi:hypothetical protein
VFAHLRALVADEFAGTVAADAGDVSDLQDLLGLQGEDIEGIVAGLRDAQSPPDHAVGNR